MCARLCQLLVFGLVVMAPVLSAQPAADFQWHGFINQGFIYSSDNRFSGNSDSGSWDATEVALGASWQIGSNVRAAVQGIYRRAGKSSPDNNPRLDYGFVEYSFARGMERGSSVRLGRVKLPYGLYNEDRDIPSNRFAALMPESIYRDPIRDLLFSVDGISVSGYQQFGAGLLLYDLSYGDSSDGLEHAERSRLGAARVVWDMEARDLRLGWTYVYVDWDLDQPRDGEEHLDFKGHILSLEYQWRHWLFMSEVELSDTFSTLPYSLEVEHTRYFAHYLSATYLFSPRLALTARYDALYDDLDDRDGHDYARLTGNPAYGAYARDWSLSLKYAPAPAWTLMLDLHQIEGIGWLEPRENPDLNQTRKHWSMLSLVASYRF